MSIFLPKGHLIQQQSVKNSYVSVGLHVYAPSLSSHWCIHVAIILGLTER